MKCVKRLKDKPRNFFFNYFLAANALLLPVSTLTAVINRWMMIPSLEQVWKRGFLCFTELEWKGKWNFFFSPRNLTDSSERRIIDV